MGGSIRRVAAACLLCGLVGTGSAEAGGGRITFSGAVVVPTCMSSEAGADVVAAGHTPASRQFTCNDKRDATRDSGGAGGYGVSVVSLGKAQSTGNPLLEYFTGYLASAHVADAKMVTRTYE